MSRNEEKPNVNNKICMYVLYNDEKQPAIESLGNHYCPAHYNLDNSGETFINKMGLYGHLQTVYEIFRQQEKPLYYGFCKTNQNLCLYEKIPAGRLCVNDDENFGFQKGTMHDCFGFENNYVEWILRDHYMICPSFGQVKELGYNSVMQYILDDIYHFDQDLIMNMIKIIHFKYPSIRPFADQYLNGNNILKQHIWLAKANVTDAYLTFLFDILFTLEKEIDLTNSGRERKKLLEFLAPHLLAIYSKYVEAEGKTVKRIMGICYSGESFTTLDPAYPNNNVCLVFSSSNRFAPYLGVALESLMNFVSPDHNYDIIIQERNIEQKEKKVLYDICGGKSNVSLRFVNLKSITSNINFYVPTKDLSEETYYTVLVPWVLSKYDKALVLDSDLIFNHDVAELYNTNIDDYYIAAIKEIVFLGFLNNPKLNVNNSLKDYVHYKLGIKDPYQYFNAGVLLINLKRFRQVFEMEELIKKINDNKYSTVEQDLLNSVCTENVLWMDYKWNLTCVLTDPQMFPDCTDPSSTTVPNLKLAPEEEINKWEKAFDNPYIYHYLTKFKPWDYPFLEYADIWWKEAKNTPYYERFIYELAIKGKTNNGNVVNIDSIAQNAIVDSRTGTRRLLDTVFPVGSVRRRIAHIFVPKGSRRSKMLKKIYRSIVPLK